jgi:hypothetical protein
MGLILLEAGDSGGATNWSGPQLLLAGVVTVIVSAVLWSNPSDQNDIVAGGPIHATLCREAAAPGPDGRRECEFRLSSLEFAGP